MPVFPASALPVSGYQGTFKGLQVSVFFVENRLLVGIFILDLKVVIYANHSSRHGLLLILEVLVKCSSLITFRQGIAMECSDLVRLEVILSIDHLTLPLCDSVQLFGACKHLAKFLLNQRLLLRVAQSLSAKRSILG